MNIVYDRQSGTPSEKRGATFTTKVLADSVLATPDNVTINNVFSRQWRELGGSRMSRVKFYKLWPERG